MNNLFIGLFVFSCMILLTSCANIIKAVNSGSIAEVEQAIAQGSDINARDADGNTPLILAARHGDLAIVHMLIKKGANLRVKNNGGYDALLALANYSLPGQSACAKDGQTEPVGITLDDHLKIAEYFLKKQVINANERTNEGNTALILAAQLNKRTLVELLLQNGANVNAVNKERRTALMFAAMKGRQDMLCLLIEKGADLQMKDKVGNTAIQYAEKYGHSKSKQRLSSACSAITSAHTKEAGDSASKPLDKKNAAELQMEEMIKALHHQDFFVRTDAARKLGEIKDARAVPVLINAMHDDHPFVRRRVAVSLGNLCDLGATETLIKALHDDDPFVQNYSIEALEKISGQKLERNARQWQDWWRENIRQH